MSDIYYQPKRTQYKSQYVPMPLDFMQKSLQAKQAKWDTTQLALDELQDMKFNAIRGGADEKYIQDIEKKINQFVDDSLTKDIGSSNYLNEFKKFKKGITSDKNIKIIESEYAKDKAIQDLKEKYIQDGKTTEGVDEVWYEAEQARKAYIKEGYAGKNRLLNVSDIRPGVNIQTDTEELFNQMKPEVVDDMLNKSYREISQDKINTAVYDNYINWLSQPAGRQVLAQFDQRFGHPPNGRGLSREKNIQSTTEKNADGTPKMISKYDQYLEEKDEFAYDRLQSIANTFTTSSGSRGNDGKGNKNKNSINPEANNVSTSGESTSYEDNVNAQINAGEKVQTAKNTITEYIENKKETNPDYNFDEDNSAFANTLKINKETALEEERQVSQAMDYADGEVLSGSNNEISTDEYLDKINNMRELNADTGLSEELDMTNTLLNTGKIEIGKDLTQDEFDAKTIDEQKQILINNEKIDAYQKAIENYISIMPDEQRVEEIKSQVDAVLKENDLGSVDEYNSWIEAVDKISEISSFVTNSIPAGSWLKIIGDRDVYKSIEEIIHKTHNDADLAKGFTESQKGSKTTNQNKKANYTYSRDVLTKANNGESFDAIDSEKYNNVYPGKLNNIWNKVKEVDDRETLINSLFENGGTLNSEIENLFSPQSTSPVHIKKDRERKNNIKAEILSAFDLKGSSSWNDLDERIANFNQKAEFAGYQVEIENQKKKNPELHKEKYNKYMGDFSNTSETLYQFEKDKFNDFNSANELVNDMEVIIDNASAPEFLEKAKEKFAEEHNMNLDDISINWSSDKGSFSLKNRNLINSDDESLVYNGSLNYNISYLNDGKPEVIERQAPNAKINPTGYYQGLKQELLDKKITDYQILDKQLTNFNVNTNTYNDYVRLMQKNNLALQEMQMLSNPRAATRLDRFEKSMVRMFSPNSITPDAFNEVVKDADGEITSGGEYKRGSKNLSFQIGNSLNQFSITPKLIDGRVLYDIDTRITHQDSNDVTLTKDEGHTLDEIMNFMLSINTKDFEETVTTSATDYAKKYLYENTEGQGE